MILAVDSDRDALDRTEAELQRRFGSDFSVRSERSAVAAVRVLDDAADHGDPVALVLVAHGLVGGAVEDVLTCARSRHPEARRAMLVEWGAWAERGPAAAILRAMAVGDVAYYVLKPWTVRDELFCRSVGEYLFEWDRSYPPTLREVVVVGDPTEPGVHRAVHLLGRNGIPHAFRDRSTRVGRDALDAAGLSDTSARVVVWAPVLGGRYLLDPTERELFELWGMPTTLAEEEREADLLVVGSGPSGLAAAVYSASEGLRTVVVEREAVGGQAGTSSLIRNYLGFSRGLTGTELAQRGYQQAWVFGARFVLGREVTALRPVDGWYEATVDGVGVVRTRGVVLAIGVSYRRLGVPDLEELIDAGVFYGASVQEAYAMEGRRVVVVGGGNSAGQAALHLARYAAQVTIAIRGPDLAATMSRYLIDAIDASPRVDVARNTEVVGGGGEGRLRRLRLRDRHSGEEREVEAEGLFVMIGAEPRTGWLPDDLARDGRGFVLAGPDTAAAGAWGLDRPCRPGETSLPGVFAVGDVRSGSIKRVASAVGEGSVVVSQVHAHLADLAAAPARSGP
jgi:thioredoxin reductase (NADPH)